MYGVWLVAAFIALESIGFPLPAEATLKTAFGEMLQHDAGWIAVLDGDRFVGVLTPSSLHGALRRSVDADAEGTSVEDVVLESAGEPVIP